MQELELQFPWESPILAPRYTALRYGARTVAAIVASGDGSLWHYVVEPRDKRRDWTFINCTVVGTFADVAADCEQTLTAAGWQPQHFTN